MWGDVANGLDIVERSGFAPQAHHRRKGRLGARNGPPAFQGVEHGGLLAANVASGADVQVQLQAEIRPQDMAPQIAFGIGLGNGDFQPMGRPLIGLAQKDIGDIGVNGIGADEQAFDELVGVALQQEPVLEGARFHLIGIDHQVFGAGGIFPLGYEAPFAGCGESGAPPAAQVGVIHRGDDLLGRHAGQRLLKCLVSAFCFIFGQSQWSFTRSVMFGQGLFHPRGSLLIGVQDRIDPFRIQIAVYFFVHHHGTAHGGTSPSRHGAAG